MSPPRPSSPDPHQQPTLSRRFRVIDRVGRGQRSESYRAIDLQSGDVVALKVLGPGLELDSPPGERFRQEAELLAHLVHPHVLGLVCGVRVHRGIAYFATEFAAHGTIAHRLAETPTIPVEEALALTLQVLDALTLVHRHGVIHRDLKPANIFLTTPTTAKLADFGIAHDDLTALTLQGDELGTPAFMPPEQTLDPGSVDASADLFALGGTLYQMITGRKSIELLMAGYRDAALLHAPNDLRDAIRRATEPHPGDRFEDAREMADELGALLDARRDRPGGSPGAC